MQISDRIGHRMRLHDLHVLMAVVQAGSMNKAAALLNTTQPAVSKSIAELERTVGVRLLDRHRQGVEPTKCGRALLDCGVTVFDDLRQGLKTIEFLADPTAGEVRIGCTHLLAGSFVSAVVDRLSCRYPRIQVQLMEMGNTPRPELRERNLDLLIARILEPLAHERLNFELLFDDSYVVVANAQSPWARRRRIKLAELVEEFVGTAAARNRHGIDGKERLSREQCRLSPRERVCPTQRAAQPIGQRTLLNDRLDDGVEVSRQKAERL